LFSLCPFDPVFGFGAFFSLKVFFGACGVGRVGDGGLAGGPFERWSAGPGIPDPQYFRVFRYV